MISSMQNTYRLYFPTLKQAVEYEILKNKTEVTPQKDWNENIDTIQIQYNLDVQWAIMSINWQTLRVWSSVPSGTKK